MWTAQAVIALRHELVLNEPKFARLCGVDGRTVRRWEMGESRPTGASEAVLDGLRYVLTARPARRNELSSLLDNALAVGGLAFLLSELLAKQIDNAKTTS